MRWIVAMVCLIGSCGAVDVGVGVEKYIQAQRIESPAEKKQLLDEALSCLLSHEGEHPSGELLYNIGNVYFHLGDLGRAIAYYRRAQQRRPRDAYIAQNLQVALQKADVEGEQIHRAAVDFLAMRWCSSFERRLILLGLLAVVCLVFSLNVWFSNGFFRWLYRLGALFILLLLAALVGYALFIPARAVVIKEAPLWSDEKASAQAQLFLSPGSMVELFSYEDGEKVHVETASGIEGYTNQSRLMYIDG